MKSLLIPIFILGIVRMSARAQLLEGPYFRTNLTLRLTVRYPESQLTNHNPPLSPDFYVVGNGLGLAWNAPTKMIRSEPPDTWSIDLKFSGSLDGYSCSECVHNQLLAPNTRFEYRILTSDLDDMVGPNFGLLLHATSKMEADFPIREHVSYPYFFTREGSVQSVTVRSSNPIINSRLWGYYLPASFNENLYKSYPILFVPDLGPRQNMRLFQSQFEQILYQNAVAEEIILIGSDDYEVESTTDGRGVLLTPTPGIYWLCAQGNPFNRCNGCIPESTTNREYIEYMRDGCGIPSVTGGRGEEYLDHMVYEVSAVINQLVNYRLRLDRDNVGISGCSLGGLLACHAAWTRPETFGMAACQSSSFWWPSQSNAENGFYFLNNTLKKTHLGPRPPQKVHIDVTDLEDDEYYAQLGAALTAANMMTANSPQFRMDETLFFTLVNGQVHGSWNCLTRTWIYMATLNPPGGAPRNPNPPTASNSLTRNSILRS